MFLMKNCYRSSADFITIHSITELILSAELLNSSGHAGVEEMDSLSDPDRITAVWQ